MKIFLALAAALVLIWGVVLWRAQARETKAEAAYPPQGRFVDVNGTRVHAVVMGEGPDLVLIHGSGGNTRDMTFRLAPALAEDYRVIIFDRPGFGYTDRLEGDESIFAQADLLSQAAVKLGAETPLVLGQSYGGAVALAWAVEHHDRLSGLIPVSSPSHPWDAPLDPFYRITSSGFGQAVVVPLITAFAPHAYVASSLESIFDPETPPDGYADHLGPGLTLRRVSMRANAVQRATLLDEITALAPRLDTIGVPTGIVHGTADTTVGMKIHAIPLSQTVDGATLTRVPEAGHMPHQTATETVTAAVARAAARAGLREQP
nr:alpha/beta hydrolase [Chachezhania antarctica]